MKPSLLIIGAGPGGEAAAKRAVRQGANVTLVEKRDLGGLCLNRGCIPSKTLLEVGRLLHQIRSAADCLQGQNGLQVKWSLLQQKKEKVVSTLRTSLTQNLSKLGVKTVQGTARFLDSTNVEVTDGKNGKTRLTADRIIIAAGSSPFFPPPFDRLQDRILDSDRALELDHVPQNILVVGGGAVGCEFACLFQELGGQVTIVEKTPALLPGEDPAVVRLLQTSFEKRGIRIVTRTTVTEADEKNGAWMCRLDDGRTVKSSHVLVCVGRRPDLEQTGLNKTGVVIEQGRFAVNEFLQTSQPNIYAVGDINGLSLLAHAAAAQGEVAADHALGKTRPYVHHLVPRCLYTWPEVASVGEWKHSAEEKGSNVMTQRFFFQGSPKAMANNETEGFIQIVSEKETGQLLGAQIIGPHATELIHIFSVALHVGMTTARLNEIIFAHPTLSEGVKEALSK